MGDDGFTIDGLGPQDVVVEYVCNYTSVVTGVTSQVRVKPSELADVPLEQVGEYIVQVRSESLLIIYSCHMHTYTLGGGGGGGGLLEEED